MTIFKTHLELIKASHVGQWQQKYYDKGQRTKIALNYATVTEPVLQLHSHHNVIKPTRKKKCTQ